MRVFCLLRVDGITATSRLRTVTKSLFVYSFVCVFRCACTELCHGWTFHIHLFSLSVNCWTKLCKHYIIILFLRMNGNSLSISGNETHSLQCHQYLNYNIVTFFAFWKWHKSLHICKTVLILDGNIGRWYCKNIDNDEGYLLCRNIS